MKIYKNAPISQNFNLQNRRIFDFLMMLFSISTVSVSFPLTFSTTLSAAVYPDISRFRLSLNASDTA